MADNAFYELQLLLGSQPVLSSSATVVNAIDVKINESVHAEATTSILVRSTNPAYVDSTLRALAATGTPLIRFRYGVGAPGKITWTAWQQHLVLDFQAKAEGLGATAGHTIKLETCDNLRQINRTLRTASYRGTVSQIVQTLAQLNGIQNTVIEPSVGDGLWVQSFQGDVDFIRTRLMKRTRSTNNRGNYHLYTRDGALHFHTTGYQTAVKNLNYYQSRGLHLSEIDLSQLKLAAGAAGARTVAYDPYTGVGKEYPNDPTLALRLGNYIPLLSTIPGAQRNFVLHVSANRPDETAYIAQNAYEAARFECFQLKVSTGQLGQLFRAGDLLRINLDPSTSSSSSWSGLYLIASAHQRIKKGAIQSVYNLQRGEQVSAAASPTLANPQTAQTVQSANVAPGVDVNLAEAQSSQLTRGADTGAPQTYLTVVQDPNSAQV